MSIRVLALALLAGVAVAQAAPPKKPPKTDPATLQQAPESLDVDAMARAKDESAATPADAVTPPPAEPPSEAPPAATPTPEAAPSESPAAAVPPSETTPPVEAPPATEASAPAEPAPAAQAPETGKPAAETAESPADTEARSLAASCAARATNLLDDAQKADFGGATRDFDAKMRTDMPPAKLKQQWESMAQFGKLVARGQSHLSSGQGYTLVMVPLIFEKTNLVAQIACGTDGRIAGFHVTQAPKPKL
jgi:cytoskeletal protein RodZ